MKKYYSELTEVEMDNLMFFLDKANTHHMDKLKRKYGVSASGKGLNKYRQAIVDNVVMDQIPLSTYISWLSEVHFEGNNSIFVYEPKSLEIFDIKVDKLIKSCQKYLTPLYNINKEQLRDIHLVDIQQDDNQLIFTYAAPSQLQVKNEETNQSELVSDVYLAYFIMDFNLQHVVLSLHPTSNLSSIAGETKKKEFDELTWVLLNKFRTQVVDFELKSADWLIDALYEITHEYFHHHNEEIDKKLSQLKKEQVPQLLNVIKAAEPIFKQEEYLLRFERALDNMFEIELTTAYGRLEIERTFGVFLHQSDKGITEFKANSRGTALNHADAGEIVKLMWDNGEITSLGLIYTHNNQGIKREHPYKIANTEKYYSLKKYNTSVTTKEVLNNVLRELNQYKQKVQSTSGYIETARQGTDDVET